MSESNADYYRNQVERNCIPSLNDIDENLEDQIFRLRMNSHTFTIHAIDIRSGRKPGTLCESDYYSSQGSMLMRAARLLEEIGK